MRRGSVAGLAKFVVSCAILALGVGFVAAISGPLRRGGLPRPLPPRR